MDTIAGRLRMHKPRSRVRATLLLPERPDPALAERTGQAVRRYCQGKLDELAQDLKQVERHGMRTLLVGLLAVFVLNSIAKPLGGHCCGDRLVRRPGSTVPNLARETRALQGRRERSYWTNTGATEDTAARRVAAARANGIPRTVH
jgi:hypothetical protein